MVNMSIVKSDVAPGEGHLEGKVDVEAPGVDADAEPDAAGELWQPPGGHLTLQALAAALEGQAERRPSRP
jgi:hypothetical protein